MILAGEKVFLRTLAPGDLDFLYRWENDPEVWRYGGCGADTSGCRSSAAERFSRDELREFIANQQYDISVTEQLRLIICRLDIGSPVGMIDLFDFDSVNLCAGVGIIVCNETDRRRGYASEALELAAGYADRVLGLRRIWCSVSAGNLPSIALFRNNGFIESKIDETTVENDENGVYCCDIAFQKFFSK